MPYSRWIKHVWRYRRANPGDLDARVREAQRQMGRDDYGRVAYDDRTSVASVAQLYALMVEVRRHLPDVTVAAAADLFQERSNGAVRQPAADREGVRSADLVQQVLEHSDHVLTQDIERDTVFEMVWDFIQARQP